MRFSFDPARPIGQRVRSLAVVDDTGNVSDRVVEAGGLIGDPDRIIKMSTLNFLASDGDGYPWLHARREQSISPARQCKSTRLTPISPTQTPTES